MHRHSPDERQSTYRFLRSRPCRLISVATNQTETQVTDAVDFSARLTSDGEYLTLCIPVRELPRTLRARPARMQIRVIPQARLSMSTDTGIPTYLLALDARLRQAPGDTSTTHSNT